MEKEMISWLIEKATKEDLTLDKQVEWLKTNYDIKISKNKEFETFLKKNNYLKIAMNYLEVIKEYKLKNVNSKELIDFVNIDSKVNFQTLIFIWKIKTKVIHALLKMNYKKQVIDEKDTEFNELIKILKKLTSIEKKQFCKEFDIDEDYFISFIVHLDNIEFLQKELLNNEGTLYSMKDENITYTSLFEYVYFCIKYLVSETESFKYALVVKECIENEKQENKLINHYKKIMDFVK